MSVLNIESKIRFENLPNEIFCEIFDCLTSDEIIYGFLNLNQRFNQFLFDNKFNLKSLISPTRNIDLWRNVGFKIKHLTIKSVDLPFSLEYFPNIQSIIIILSFDSSHKQIHSIISNNQFRSIREFRVKRDKLFSKSSFDRYTNSSDFILQNILNDQNSLEAFEYVIPISYRLDTSNFMINSNLQSLILTLEDFNSLFVLMQYTPNLKKLNLHSDVPGASSRLMNKINIKLEELHLKFTRGISVSNFSSNEGTYYGNLLVDLIKSFSSSLICLSLVLGCSLGISTIENFPFNSSKAQQLLETMKQLKQFHLYARTDLDKESILSQFQNQFWFDRQLYFGMHSNCFYTLPFYFDYLHESYTDFHIVESNYSDFLDTNHQLWYNVKSLNLSMSYQYDMNFVKQLKIQMPKLNYINFIYRRTLQNSDEYVISNQTDLTLNSVKTIEITGGFNQQINHWLIHFLPNVKNLILSFGESASTINQVLPNIERLYIDERSNLEELTSISYTYYPNIQFIQFHLSFYRRKSEWYADMIIQILHNFKNLKRVLLYPLGTKRLDNSVESESIKLVRNLNVQEMNTSYRIKHYKLYSVFENI